MSARAAVAFTASAVDDLDGIVSYYSEERAPESGRQLVLDIMKQIERLADFPESGRIVPEFGLVCLREIIYPPFRIVYRFETRKISIIRIWRSERMLRLADENQ